jgi:SET domain-containing protein
MALMEKFLRIRKSSLPGAGKGLFTSRFIPKGSLVVEYKGRVTTWKDVDHKEGTNGYIYFIRRNHVIDAGNYRKALGRYANDSLGLKRIPGTRNNAEYLEDGDKVFIRATRDIYPGTEILVSYGKEYWDVIRHNLKVEKLRAKKVRKKKSDG